MEVLFLEWFDYVFECYDFLDDVNMKFFNEVFVFVIMGRVMFVLNDSIFGLGLGSMIVGDEVMMFLGISLFIVFWFCLFECDEFFEGFVYVVVGDCYFDFLFLDE